MKKYVFVLIIAVIMLNASNDTVYAGSLNRDEQSLVEALQGTFEYEGVTYKVSSAYVNQVIVYLKNDSVNLTKEQAEEIIGVIQANLKMGIEAGYIVEVAEQESNAVKDGQDQKTTKEIETKETEIMQTETEDTTLQESEEVTTKQVTESITSEGNNSKKKSQKFNVQSILVKYVFPFVVISGVVLTVIIFIIYEFLQRKKGR